MAQSFNKTQKLGVSMGQEDLGPLAWVLDEVKASVEVASKALKQFASDASVAASVDLASLDDTQLRLAGQQLHQAMGALTMVGLEKPSKLLQQMNAAIQRFLLKPELCTPEAAGVIDKAGYGLTFYLESYLAGRKMSAIALFPQYEEVAALADYKQVHPSQLWEFEWKWLDVACANELPVKGIDAATRKPMDKWVLQVVRGLDVQAATELRDTALAISQSELPRQTIAFWRLVAGYFDAISQDLLADNRYTKRAASQVLMQFVKQMKAPDQVSQDLARELLFHCAQCPTGDATSALGEVRAAYDLHTHVPVDYETMHFGQVDPATVARAKKYLSTVKETWSLVSSGEMNRADQISMQFAKLSGELSGLLPSGEGLAVALQKCADAVAQTKRAPSTTVALEVATAVLYTEAVLEDFDLNDPTLPERTTRLQERIESAHSGAPAEPLENWMEELYRRVSDKQNMGSVVGELKSTLAEVEKHMDEYFRDPSNKDVLRDVPHGMSQMRGVLSVLGLDDATQTVLQMREVVENIVIGDASPDALRSEGIFERLGNNLGALGFLIDMLSYQPSLAKKLFVFDSIHGELRPLMGRQQDEASEEESKAGFVPSTVIMGGDDWKEPSTLIPDLEGADADALTATDGSSVTSAEEPVLLAEDSAFSLAADEGESAQENTATNMSADLMATEKLNVADLLPAAEELSLDAPPANEREASEQVADVAMTSSVGNETPEASAVVSEPVAVVESEGGALTESNDQDDDDAAFDEEIFEIFLEEARETIEQGKETIVGLRKNPANISDLTNLRRSYHTLKGSGRMVELMEFSNAAWSMEQLFNAWLAESRSATDELLDLAAKSLDGLGDWVEAIANKQDKHLQSEPYAVSADAMRIDKQYIPLDLDGVSEVAPVEVSEVAAPVSDVTVTDAAIEEPISLEELEHTATPVSGDSLGLSQLTEEESSSVDVFADEGASVTVEEEEASVVQPTDELVAAFDADGIASNEESSLAAEEVAGDLFDTSASLDPFADVLPAGVEQSIENVETEDATETAGSTANDFSEVSDFNLDLLDAGQAESEEESSGLGGGAAVAGVVAAGVALAASKGVEETNVINNGSVEDADIALVSEDIVEEQPESVQITSEEVVEQDAPPLHVSVEQTDDTDALVSEALDSGFESSSDDDQYKVIGPLRINIPLYNVYMSEADEWSRMLVTTLCEWAMEPHRLIPEDAVSYAHSLAGSSATIGYLSLSKLSRELEYAMDRDLQAGSKEFAHGHANAFVDAAKELRVMLQNFAAGELQDPQPETLENLATILQEEPPAVETTMGGLSMLDSSMERLLQAEASKEEDWEARVDLDAPVADSGYYIGSLDKTNADGASGVVKDKDVEPIASGDLKDTSSFVSGLDNEPQPVLSSMTDVSSESQGAVEIEAEQTNVVSTEISNQSLSDQHAIDEGLESVLIAEEDDVLNEVVDDSIASSVVVDAASVESVSAEEVSPSLVVSASTFTPLMTDDTSESNLSEEKKSVLISATDAEDAESGADIVDVEDVLDEDLFPVFEEEAQELIPELSSGLREWNQNVENKEARSQVLRVLHTLKGSARLAGALRLGEMAHHLESTIESIGSDDIDNEQVSPLLEECDSIVNEFDRLRALDQAEQVAIEEQLVATNESATKAGASAQTGSNATAQTDSIVQVREQESGNEIGASVSVVTTEHLAKPLTATQISKKVPNRKDLTVKTKSGKQTVRVRSQLLDRILNQTGEVMITRSRLEGGLGQLKTSVGDLSNNLERLRAQLRDVEVQAETQMQSRMAQNQEALQTFDPLEFDRFTRMQELTRMMAESVNDVATVQRAIQKIVDVTEMDLTAQARQTRELQRDLLRTRMVEFDSISERLYRVVRQSAKETGKSVRLDLFGGRIEMDRGVLDKMTPVFEHLLRNAVAHGIEAVAGRIQAGKDEVGTISVSVSQEGNDVAIEFRDDGAGLNLDAIKLKAQAQGLIEDRDNISDAEAANLVFMSGFSTAKDVTRISGRGVGMDVVRTEVNSLGGRVETSTERGKGTRFKVVVPLTTAVTQVVMLKAGEVIIGVPANLLEIVRRAIPAQVSEAYEKGVFKHGQDTLPFHWMGALLQSSKKSESLDSKTLSVVVFRSAAQRIAAHVDEVLGNQEVVVKNLGPQLSNMPGLAGMSILPSGSVVLIYNPVALATVYGETVREYLADKDVVEEKAAVSAVPLIMVVDDSITVRRITQRFLQREGYRVVLAADGLQALEKLPDEMPAVVLSDIEMPRMDGFDLLRNIRANDAYKDMPVVMITSRIAEKHKEHALSLGANHYLGKPYSEEQLLQLVRGYTQETPEETGTVH